MKLKHLAVAVAVCGLATAGTLTLERVVLQSMYSAELADTILGDGEIIVVKDAVSELRVGDGGTVGGVRIAGLRGDEVTTNHTGNVAVNGNVLLGSGAFESGAKVTVRGSGTHAIYADNITGEYGIYARASYAIFGGAMDFEGNEASFPSNTDEGTGVIGSGAGFVGTGGFFVGPYIGVRAISMEGTAGRFFSTNRALHATGPSVLEGNTSVTGTLYASGALTLGTEGTTPSNAVTKAQMDAADVTKLAITNGAAVGLTVTTPTETNHPATKAYVDAIPSATAGVKSMSMVTSFAITNTGNRVHEIYYEQNLAVRGDGFANTVLRADGTNIWALTESSDASATAVLAGYPVLIRGAAPADFNGVWKAAEYGTVSTNDVPITGAVVGQRFMRIVSSLSATNATTAGITDIGVWLYEVSGSAPGSGIAVDMTKFGVLGGVSQAWQIRYNLFRAGGNWTLSSSSSTSSYSTTSYVPQVAIWGTSLTERFALAYFPQRVASATTNGQFSFFLRLFLRGDFVLTPIDNATGPTGW